MNGKLTELIPVEKGTRQRDSLIVSLVLSNIVMNEIIKRTRRAKNKRGNKNITILCYADDAVLLAESEDELQHLINANQQI